LISVAAICFADADVRDDVGVDYYADDVLAYAVAMPLIERQDRR